jgi:hypothetical protein
LLIEWIPTMKFEYSPIATTPMPPSPTLLLAKRFWADLTWDSVYTYIFNSNQYPFWTVVQVVWSVYVVERSVRVKRPRRGKARCLLNWLGRFALSFAVAFLGGEAYAQFLGGESPLFVRREPLVIFVVTFGLVTLTPFGSDSQLFNIFGFAIALLQAGNQVRFYRVAFNGMKKWPVHQTIPIAYGFSALDMVIEGFFRPLVGGEETPLSNGAVIYRGFLLALVHWLFTHDNQFTRWIGLCKTKSKPLSLLVLAIGGWTALLVLVDAARGWRKPPRRRKAQSARQQNLAADHRGEEGPDASDHRGEEDQDPPNCCEEGQGADASPENQ